MQTFSPLTHNQSASGAISPYRIVKGTVTDGTVAQATADTDKFVGVSGQNGAADGERIDINKAGIVPVQYGGNVAYGDPLTSSAAGKAIVAVAGDRVLGVAQENGDLDAIGSILLSYGQL